ncbi:putative NinX [Vibrio phage 199E37-1]|nr:putative NinX [Vibrio phage 199E37-1]
MNYEEMSDFEINKLVVLAIDTDGDIESVTQRKSKLKCISNQALVKLNDINEPEPFNPCNNPSDAWSIILENKINIEWRDSLKLHPLAKGTGGNACHWSDKNPLRAAMICFLKMKDAENA